MAKVHRLKTEPPYFDKVRVGLKPFEIRKDDRGFAEDDILVLDEWSPKTGYTKAKPLVRMVTYLLRGGQFGLAEGYVAMAVDELADEGAAKIILHTAPSREPSPPSSTEISK